MDLNRNNEYMAVTLSLICHQGFYGKLPENVIVTACIAGLVSAGKFMIGRETVPYLITLFKGYAILLSVGLRLGHFSLLHQ